MDVDGLPIVGAAVDLTKVASIHHKRTLAFLNHFISHTINFLNKFSRVCETKLEDINTRVQRMETSLSILEAKLSSIPGLDDVSTTLSSSRPPEQPDSTKVEQAPVSNFTSADNVSTDVSKDESQESEMNNTTVEDVTKTVSQDPRYTKYFKLLQMGVPPMAFRAKMTAEGLNPDLLGTPNAPVPPQASDTESASSSDFSD